VLFYDPLRRVSTSRICTADAPPGETINLKLTRLLSNHEKPSFLIPPNDPDPLAGTHPSDHNAVFAFNHKKMSENSRQAHQKKIEKRRKRDEELATKGKMDQRSIRAHDAAFDACPAFFLWSWFWWLCCVWRGCTLWVCCCRPFGSGEC
jgi:hypothetical protein